MIHNTRDNTRDKVPHQPFFCQMERGKVERGKVERGKVEREIVLVGMKCKQVIEVIPLNPMEPTQGIGIIRI